MNKLFVYGINPSDFEKIKEKIHTAKVYALDDSILESTVHEVVDVPYMRYICSEKEHAFLILESQDSVSGWKVIIDELKKVNNCPQLIKISVTKNNRKWPMKILFDHVLKEHQLYSYRYELKQVMIEAANKMQYNLTEEFQTDLSIAFRVYDDQSSSIENIIDATHSLMKYCEMN